jgi:hypothetical protein
MKLFLASGMLSFLSLGVILMPQVSQGCEIYDHANNRINALNCALNKLDEEILYTKNMDFYMGYLQGQRQAFYEVKKLIDDLYPN